MDVARETANAKACARSGRLDEARAICQRILQRDAGCLAALLIVVEVALAQRRFIEAQTYLGRAARRHPGHRRVKELQKQLQRLAAEATTVHQASGGAETSVAVPALPKRR